MYIYSMWKSIICEGSFVEAYTPKMAAPPSLVGQGLPCDWCYGRCRSRQPNSRWRMGGLQQSGCSTKRQHSFGSRWHLSFCWSHRWCTHTHTQNVESYWGRIKTKLKRMKGCTANQLPRHLDEFMWKDRHGTTRCECNGQEGLFPVAFVEEL